MKYEKLLGTISFKSRKKYTLWSTRSIPRVFFNRALGAVHQWKWPLDLGLTNDIKRTINPHIITNQNISAIDERIFINRWSISIASSFNLKPHHNRCICLGPTMPHRTLHTTFRFSREFNMSLYPVILLRHKCKANKPEYYKIMHLQVINQINVKNERIRVGRVACCEQICTAKE